MGLIIKTTSWEDYLDTSGEAHVKALIMGQHDAGKTRSASFWPGVIFADTEDGRMSISDRGVPYGRIRSSADMDDLLNQLRLECQKPAAKRRFKTLVIDTFDAYQRILIQERLKAERKDSLSGWADWGYLDAKMVQLIEKLLNLPMNIIVNLHTKDVSDGDGDDSILVKKARLKGDIKDSIFQDFDLIGQMETYFVAEKGERVVKRHIRWHSDPNNPNPRDRSGRLPRYTDIDFTDQDYWRIFNAMTSGLEGLPESQTVLEIESTSTDAEAVPAGPAEKGGPVDVAPEEVKPKGARAAKKTTPAKKAAAPEPKAEEPPAEPAAPKVQTEVAEESKTLPESTPEVSSKNGKGTADLPVVLDQKWELAKTFLDEGKLRSLDHAHSSDGGCVKNRYGDECKATGPGAAGADVWGRKAAEPEAPASTDVDASQPEDPHAEHLAESAAEPEPTPEVAEATVADALGGEVVSAPGERNENECGFVPTSHQKFDDQPPGCAKDLDGQNKAKVNLSLLRAHAKLCESCFDSWKSAQA